MIPKNGLFDSPAGGKGGANQVMADWKKSVTNLFLNIDGQPVNNLQSDFVQSDWFSPRTAQPGSLIESFGFTGELGPAKTNGYWAVVSGFAPNSTHTLDFGGSTSQAFRFTSMTPSTFHHDVSRRPDPVRYRERTGYASRDASKPFGSARHKDFLRPRGLRRLYRNSER